MRKEIMQALQQEYEQQRLKNSQEEMRRRQEVITRCPEIGQYLAERQNLIFGGVRGILNGKAAADDLPARMDVMNKRIADLLRQSGFPAVPRHGLRRRADSRNVSVPAQCVLCAAVPRGRLGRKGGAVVRRV